MGSDSLVHEANPEWVIDSEAMKARGVIVFVKSMRHEKLSSIQSMNSNDPGRHKSFTHIGLDRTSCCRG